jgi:uncharacterized protein (TIGR03435 family)
MMRLLALMNSVLVSLVIAAAASARIPAQGPAAEVRLIHPESGTAPSFEVATIKPSDDPRDGFRVMLSPAHFSVTHGSLSDLIKFAYGTKSDDQVVGAPAWMSTEHFDIQAKAGDAEIAEFGKLDVDHRINISALLMQSLLQDRFQLKAHVETRELPVYALVVAKGGIKMKAVQADPFPPPGVQPPPGAHLPSMRPSGQNQWTATAWPMDRMVEWLSFCYEVGNRPVVDETGLKGSYDWVLNGVAFRPPAASDANGGNGQEATVSLFSALPDQLGLRLEPKKAPVEVLVIDHVEQPTAN